MRLNVAHQCAAQFQQEMGEIGFLNNQRSRRKRSSLQFQPFIRRNGEQSGLLVLPYAGRPD
jgi:hypothetical protein